MTVQPTESGFSPAWHYEWHGTGSQAEYERAAKMPTCRYCAKRLAEDSRPWHERRTFLRGLESTP